MRDCGGNDEWSRLRSERADARRRWVAAAAELEVRASDPFGIKRFVRDHPGVAAGVGAGAAALLVKMLFGSGGRKDADREDPGEEQRNGESDRGSPLITALRRAAISIAVPWISRTVAERVARHVAERAAETGRAPDASP